MAHPGNSSRFRPTRRASRSPAAATHLSTRLRPGLSITARDDRRRALPPQWKRNRGKAAWDGADALSISWPAADDEVDTTFFKTPVSRVERSFALFA